MPCRASLTDESCKASNILHFAAAALHLVTGVVGFPRSLATGTLAQVAGAIFRIVLYLVGIHQRLISIMILDGQLVKYRIIVSNQAVRRLLVKPSLTDKRFCALCACDPMEIINATATRTALILFCSIMSLLSNSCDKDKAFQVNSQFHLDFLSYFQVMQKDSEPFFKTVRSNT